MNTKPIQKLTQGELKLKSKPQKNNDFNQKEKCNIQKIYEG